MDSDPLEIPPDALSAQALRGVIEAFVLREGTDYGPRTYSLEEKVEQVRAQLRCRDARILFDPVTESITIAMANDPQFAASEPRNTK